MRPALPRRPRCLRRSRSSHRLGTNVTVENAVDILKQTCNPNEDNYRDVKENAIGFTAQNIASA